MVQSYFPNATFGADIIVGYPGETEDQFSETYNLLKELPISHFHVFPYSKRQKTTAAKLENHIQADVKKRRVRTLINLGEEKKESLSKLMIGKTSDVLFEREKDGVYEGYTSNYTKVAIETNRDLKNQIVKVKFTSCIGSKLSGDLLDI
jgi:threonylcarbamoyladenosine tRNA methylthiotransferase MtaB